MMFQRFTSTATLALGICSVALITGPTPAAAKGPVKVFILAGQSNMEGKALVTTLDAVINDPETQEESKHLKPDGKWLVRDDVWVRFQTARQGLLKGGLTIGYTGYGNSTHIGPELQFGHAVGDYLENQVLLIKTAWGGKSLYKDFRPPSSGGEVGPYYVRMLLEVKQARDGKKCQPFIRREKPSVGGV